MLCLQKNQSLWLRVTLWGGYVPKDCCTFDRYGGAGDELSCCDICEECGNNCDVCCIQKVFNRLAEYEETGLSPSDIKKLLAGG